MMTLIKAIAFGCATVALVGGTARAEAEIVLPMAVVQLDTECNGDETAVFVTVSNTTPTQVRLHSGDLRAACRPQDFRTLAGKPVVIELSHRQVVADCCDADYELPPGQSLTRLLHYYVRLKGISRGDGIHWRIDHRCERAFADGWPQRCRLAGAGTVTSADLTEAVRRECGPKSATFLGVDLRAEVAWDGTVSETRAGRTVERRTKTVKLKEPFCGMETVVLHQDGRDGRNADYLLMEKVLPAADGHERAAQTLDEIVRGVEGEMGVVEMGTVVNPAKKDYKRIFGKSEELAFEAWTEVRLDGADARYVCRLKVWRTDSYGYGQMLESAYEPEIVMSPRVPRKVCGDPGTRTGCCRDATGEQFAVKVLQFISARDVPTDDVERMAWETLAFLAHGETPGSRQYGEAVEQRIEGLMAALGTLPTDGDAFYAAAYALVEAYWQTKNPNVRAALDLALDKVAAGRQADGLWESWKRTGLAVQALRAAGRHADHGRPLADYGELLASVTQSVKAELRKDDPTDEAIAVGGMILVMMGARDGDEAQKAARIMGGWQYDGARPEYVLRCATIAKWMQTYRDATKEMHEAKAAWWAGIARACRDVEKVTDENARRCLWLALDYMTAYRYVEHWRDLPSRKPADEPTVEVDVTFEKPETEKTK